MSTGEVIGLAITMAAFGAASALVIAGVYKPKAGALGRTDALARWLAARKTLNSSARSFVAAFRALASQQPDSAFFDLRMDEAQRSRDRLHDAMRSLEKAEATLVAWAADWSIDEAFSTFARVSAADLRNAINGDARALALLDQQLRRDDQRAITFVKRATTNDRGRHSAIRKLLSKSRIAVESILQRTRR